VVYMVYGDELLLIPSSLLPAPPPPLPLLLPPSPSSSPFPPSRVAGVVRLWIKTSKAELVKDATFLKLLRELQDCLSKDSLTEEVELLNSSISDSIRGSGGFGSSLLPSSNMGNLKVRQC